MKIVRLSSQLTDGKTEVIAVLQNFDEVTKELDPERHTFAVSIDDLDAASQTTKHIARILTALDEVVQLVYNVQFIQHQIDQATTDEEDTTQLSIDLQVAVDALNADPDIVPAR